MADESMSIFDAFTRISDQDAEMRMHPRGQCLHGFLGSDESLKVRLAQDAEIMRSLGLDFDKVAVRIEEIFATPDDLWGPHPMLKLRYIAGMRCPWNDFLSSSIFSMIPEVREVVLIHSNKTEEAISILLRHEPVRGDITIQSYGDLVRSNCAMILSDLHPHLLREHQFLQGLSTPYRLHPDRLEEYLGPLK